MGRACPGPARAGRGGGSRLRALGRERGGGRPPSPYDKSCMPSRTRSKFPGGGVTATNTRKTSTPAPPVGPAGAGCDPRSFRASHMIPGPATRIPGPGQRPTPTPKRGPTHAPSRYASHAGRGRRRHAGSARGGALQHSAANILRTIATTFFHHEPGVISCDRAACLCGQSCGNATSSPSPRVRTHNPPPVPDRKPSNIIS
jgi:hypothetical protein